MNSGEEHPLISSGLPEWLLDVPIGTTESTLISFTEDGKAISAEILRSALYADVGTTLGALAMPPDLAQAVAEFTENPGWRRLAPEPTWVKRMSEDGWELTIGDYTEVLSRAALEAKLAEVPDDNVGQ